MTYRTHILAFIAFSAILLVLPLRGEDLPAQRPATLPSTAPATQPTISVYFSPKGGCTAAVVAELDKATTSVHIQAYSFTSAPIAKAIIEAKKRGVTITVVLDKSQRTATYSSARFLKNRGAAVYIDDRHAIAHNKIILIDGRVILTGSFNFTAAAESKNAENLLVITGHPDLSDEYEKNFQEHLAHSGEYKGKDGEPAP